MTEFAVPASMAERKRRLWRIDVTSRSVDVHVPYRHPERRDCDVLGALMLDAYQGTIDERYKALAETTDHIDRYFDSDFGTPLLSCSYLAVQDTGLISATLVSMDGDEPLLAQAFTAPEWQNQGLASALIQLSINALAEAGLPVLTLVVTAGNQPAEHVYRKLGFKPS